MRINRHLLVQRLDDDEIVILDESTAAEIVMGPATARHLAKALLTLSGAGREEAKPE